MKLTILGSNSAIPAHGRMPTAQILELANHMVLIDCGEGTQIQLSKYNIRRTRIDIVCISHLHGDHVFGLAGFLSSLSHFKHDKDIHIFGPEGLDILIETQLALTGNPLSYDLYFHLISEDSPGLVFESDHLHIHAFPVSHRIPTFGYLFTQKGVKRKINMEAVEAHNVPVEALKSISQGADYQSNGQVIKNEILTFDPPKEKQYAFVTDTDYLPGLSDVFPEVDVLYHEATFMQEHVDKARDTKHSTASEAAQVAKSANAGQLILGHYSSRYAELKPLLDEARAVFPHTDLAIEGRQFEI